MINDLFNIRGCISIYDADTGDKLAYSHNKVVNLGITRILEIISGQSTVSTNLMNYIAIGTGNTPVTENDTALNSEHHRDLCESSVANNVLYLTSYVSKNDSSFVIKEAGVFDKVATDPASLMFCRSVLETPFDNQTDPKNLTITWTLTLSNN